MGARGMRGLNRGDGAARATALIRALTGVVDARVDADASGIRAIVVVAEPALSAWEVARNVQSALLASLGLTIDTAVVEVTPAVSASPPSPGKPAREPLAKSAATNGKTTTPQNGNVAAAPNGNGAASVNGKTAATQNGKAAASVNGKAATQNGSAPATQNGRAAGVENGKGSRPLVDADPNVHSNEAATPVRNGRSGWAGRPSGTSNGRARAVEPLGFAGEDLPPNPGCDKPWGSAGIARLEIETRAGGRVGCRVVVAARDRIAAGEADGLDTPNGRLEAVARAVLSATRLERADLDGIRFIDLAGRKYVIVAVRCWSGRETLYRAEVALANASPEAAAAEATLGAIMQVAPGHSRSAQVGH